MNRSDITAILADIDDTMSRVRDLDIEGHSQAATLHSLAEAWGHLLHCAQRDKECSCAGGERRPCAPGHYPYCELNTMRLAKVAWADVDPERDVRPIQTSPFSSVAARGVEAWAEAGRALDPIGVDRGFAAARYDRHDCRPEPAFAEPGFIGPPVVQATRAELLEMYPPRDSTPPSATDNQAVRNKATEAFRESRRILKGVLK